jgi:hypothetical protein
VDLTIRFVEDVNLDEIEKFLGMKASKKKTKEEAKGKNKFARITFYTPRTRDFYPTEVLEKFLLKIHENIKKIPQVLKQHNGKASICIVIDKTQEIPSLYLSQTVIDILSECKIEFDVDYV